MKISALSWYCKAQKIKNKAKNENNLKLNNGPQQSIQYRLQQQ
jgi:hypothetical protein